jgi:hypothetical protein
MYILPGIFPLPAADPTRKTFDYKKVAFDISYPSTATAV